jgi:hypothetical protein
LARAIKNKQGLYCSPVLRHPAGLISGSRGNDLCCVTSSVGRSMSSWLTHRCRRRLSLRHIASRSVLRSVSRLSE